MDFINQVKKLKEVTKSPEVRTLCESFLNGGSVSESDLVKSINEHNITPDFVSNTQNHLDMIRKEEAELSKKNAAALMESWGGLKNASLNNAGSYISRKEEKEDVSLLESLSQLEGSDLDSTAKSFIKSQEVNNLGIRLALNSIKESSIYSYPKAKIMVEQYSNLLENKGVPEFSLVHNFLNDIKSLSWDKDVAQVAESVKEKCESLSREIEVAKVLEALKNSGNSSFYSELNETLNAWLVSEKKSNGLLVKNISKWNFNPMVRGLINYLNVNETEDKRKLEIPETIQGESSVSRVYSPVLLENGRSLFYLGGFIFEANEEGLRKISDKEISALPQEYLSLVYTYGKKHVRVNENGIFIKLGKSIVRLVEENDEVTAYMGKTRLKFSDPSGLAKIVGLESGSYFGVNESDVVNDIMNLYTNYSNIVELDFAKSLTSNVYEGVGVNLFKWMDQIYLQKINDSMNENSIHKVTGTQAVSVVKNYLRYDISEGLTEFLEGESKVKSVMINDREKVISNISKVDEELNKINTLIGSSPLYGESDQIKTAKRMLESELVMLREKWNQINLEIEKIELDINMSGSLDLFEDEKFNIGSYIKVKESGETGKIISMDGTSGRYTVLLDNGKTSDFLINEISDLEEALSQAAEKNAESSDEDGEEEVKESNNLNKSDLSIEEQKNILKNFADMHGFTKAPKGETEEKIELGLDSLHGYNISMNEESSEDLKKK
jgi:hypothetical protein